MLKDLTVGNICRTGGFTRQTSNALRSVEIRPRIFGQSPICFLAPKTKAAARRIIFVAGQLICRTNFKAEAAMNATRQEIVTLDGIGRRRFRCFVRRGHEMFDSCSKVLIQRDSIGDGARSARWQECQSPPTSCSWAVLAAKMASIRLRFSVLSGRYPWMTPL